MMDRSNTQSADEIFHIAMSWLRTNYSNYTFFAERDLVWTIQTRLVELVSHQHFPFRVFNDHRVELGDRRVYCDLVIASDDHIDLGVEFKYEPSHARKALDIPAGKFPVCFWKEGVGGDMIKVRALVDSGTVPRAHAILVDEGGYWRRLRQQPYDGARWIDWNREAEGSSPSLHWFTVGESA